MKIRSYEIFRCDAGWRLFSFLKLVTDSGPVGWSEYNESFGSPGLSGVIHRAVACPAQVWTEPSPALTAALKSVGWRIYFNPASPSAVS